MNTRTCYIDEITYALRHTFNPRYCENQLV